MDTTLLVALVSSIGIIVGGVATTLATLYACGKDILKCFGILSRLRAMGEKKDIEAVPTSPKDHEMKPAVDAPQSSSSLRNVSRDSLVKLQQKEIFYKVEGSLMTLLRNCLESDNKNYVSILTQHVDHYQRIKLKDDSLRNIQMISSHLLSQRQEAREALYGGRGFVPNIAALQRWIELAWENGFGKKVSGKRIGARDCAALLRYFGLRAKVVDFESTSSSFKVGKRDAKVEKDHHVLTEWVWNYFSDKNVNRSGDDVILSEKAPLYFQDYRQSITIVGIQATRESDGMPLYNLLIFDPARETKSLEECLINDDGWQKLIKRGSHTLKKPVYQLCYVDPGIACGEELENLKTIDSIRIEF